MSMYNRSRLRHFIRVEDVIRNVKESGCFGRSDRQLRLLEYLLRKTAARHHGEVTQATIAIEVLGRPEDFDPTGDSIVRVEMHRLRTNIEKYNDGDFKYCVNIKPSDYEIVVSRRTHRMAIKRFKKPSTYIGAALVVSAVFVGGMISEIIPGRYAATSEEGLCSAVLPNVRVESIGEQSEAHVYVNKVVRATISQQTGVRLLNADSGNCEPNAAPEFKVEYAIVEENEKTNVIFTLTDGAHQIIGSFRVSGMISALNEENDLYFKLVSKMNEISMPDSVIARQAVQSDWAFPQRRENFSCVLMMYDSFSGEKEASFEKVNSCLEKSLNSDLTPPDNYGALAAGYLDMARSQDVEQETSFVEKAKALLSAPGVNRGDSAEVMIASIYYEAQAPDYNKERLELLLSEAESRYNLNPQVLMVAAYFRAYSLGDWDSAKALSDFVKKIYLLRDQSLFAVDAGYALIRKNTPDLMGECSKFYAKGSRFINIIVNACARRAGDQDWYALTEENLEEMGLQSHDDRVEVLELMQTDLFLQKEIRASLEGGFSGDTR